MTEHPGGRGLGHRLRVIAAQPRIRKRRREDVEPMARMFLEHFRYSDAIYSLFEATARDPKITHWFDLPEQAVVLDIGAYVGEWCVPVADCSPASITIHSYEPGPPHLEDLRDAIDGYDNIVVHPVGVGAANTTASLAFKGPGSSIFDTSKDYGRTQIEIVDIAEVLADTAGPDGRINVMKLNIEGGEYDLLDRIIELDRSSDIDHLLIQFHDWLPRATRRRWKIRQELKKTHDLIWDFPWIWEYWRARGTG